MLTKTAAKRKLTTRLVEALYGVKPVSHTARNAVLGALAGGTAAAPVGAVRGFRNPGQSLIDLSLSDARYDAIHGAFGTGLGANLAAEIAGLATAHITGGVRGARKYGLGGAALGGAAAGGLSHMGHKKRMAKYLLRKRLVNAGLGTAGAGGLAAALASKKSRK